MKDEGLSVDVQFLVSLPIPNAPEPLANQIRDVTSRLLGSVQEPSHGLRETYSLEQSLNRMVEDAFGLSPAERGILSRTLPARDPLAVLEGKIAESGDLPCEVQVGRILSFIILLLRTWNKSAVRNALEAAIVLMLNDGARRQILGRSGTSASTRARQAAPEFVHGLDGLLQEAQTTEFVEIATIRKRQVIRLGAKAPPTDNAPTADVERVLETLRALEVIGEDQALAELEGIVHERYALVP